MSLHCWLICFYPTPPPPLPPPPSLLIPTMRDHSMELCMVFCICSRFINSTHIHHASTAYAHIEISSSIGSKATEQQSSNSSSNINQHKSNTDSNYVIIDGNSQFHECQKLWCIQSKPERERARAREAESLYLYLQAKERDRVKRAHVRMKFNAKYKNEQDEIFIFINQWRKQTSKKSVETHRNIAWKHRC